MTADPGLCATCRHRREIVSDRGSRFTQCRLAFTRPAFARYPRLPVLACHGHEPAGYGGNAASQTDISSNSET